MTVRHRWYLEGYYLTIIFSRDDNFSGINEKVKFEVSCIILYLIIGLFPSFQEVSVIMVSFQILNFLSGIFDDNWKLWFAFRN
jgi:hypothetical protein